MITFVIGFHRGRVKLLVRSIDEIRSREKKVFEDFLENPGINANKHPHSRMWVEKNIRNANLNTFPNLNINAITVRGAHLRGIPTPAPSFSSLTKAGWWYPFDNLQWSFIRANIPIKVLHVSRDGQWYLVVTPNCFGWLPNDAVRLVDYTFMKRWQTGRYVIMSQDDVPGFDNQLNLVLRTKMGVLYPLSHSTQFYQKLLVAKTGSNQNAVIGTANIKKKYVYDFPIEIRPENIARIANKMIGSPYGWSGMYEYRDCSATLMDLFAFFGIWLPRNSSAQAEMGGNFISLASLSNAEKEKFIIKNAVPFLTLVHSHGHIMLYIGHDRQKSYVFHAKWGLKTRNIVGREGRAVFGRTVITPLRIGEGYINVFKPLLNDVDGITFLGSSS